MDFVVAGLGLGALIVVVGFVVRDLGPILWRVSRGRRSTEQVEEDQLWIGLCQSISVVLTFSGVAILIATVLAVILGFSDDLGTQVVIVVSAVSLLASAALLALNIRDYRKESTLQSAASLGGLRSNGRPLPTSLSSQSAATAISSAKAVRKPAESVESPAVVVPAHAPEPEAYDPHLDEPFDATKLLASEFDHHDPDSDLAMFAPSEMPPSEMTGLTKPDVIEVEADDYPVGELVSDVVERAVVDQPETSESSDASLVDASPGEDTVLSTVFRSPLLADISGSGTATNGSFESKLLADVNIHADDHADDFVSPLFADLDIALEDKGADPVDNEVEDTEGLGEESRQATTAVKKN